MSVHHNGSRPLSLQLPPALQLHILSFLPPNDRALSGRLVSPDAAAGLSQDPTCTASLSQPLPPHAVPWAVEAVQQHVRQLPFRRKVQLLCTAARSGSKVNLEAAWKLLKVSSVFPQLLQDDYSSRQHRGMVPHNSDPGVAAVKAGHPQVLPWLLRRCPGLVGHHDVLTGAARHCDLVGLQVAWRAVTDSTELAGWVLDAAAASPTPDAIAKMEWVLGVDEGSCSLQASTAAAAARSGDVGRLRWLREQGCPMGGFEVLQSALEHGGLAMVQWLVDEAGCDLPAASGEEGQWEKLLEAAAKGPDGVAMLQWLRERGSPPLGDARDSGQDLILRPLRSAAEAGRAEVVQHLLSLLAPTPLQRLTADHELFHCAVDSGSIPTAELLLGAGFAVSHEAYEVSADAAARKEPLAVGGHVAMVRWLVREAGVSAAGFNLQYVLRVWPTETTADSQDLLQVVQLLVGEAGCRAWDARMALVTAARRGELALVQYLLQQARRRRPHWECVVNAAEGGCEALLEWLVKQHPGCLKGSGSGESPYVSAAARGDLGTLTALRRLGVPWGAEDVVVQAVRERCSVPALRWLVEQGAPVGEGEEVEVAVECALDNWVEDAEDAAWLLGLREPNRGYA